MHLELLCQAGMQCVVHFEVSRLAQLQSIMWDAICDIQDNLSSQIPPSPFDDEDSHDGYDGSKDTNDLHQ